MKEQRAVEWLVEQICGDHTEQWHKEIEQAKEMEKEQIIKAYNTSFLLRDKPYSTAEQYYNETFKQQEQ